MGSQVISSYVMDACRINGALSYMGKDINYPGFFFYHFQEMLEIASLLYISSSDRKFNYILYFLKWIQQVKG